jgi:predicted KAP-like P-loop ATPase
METKTITIRVDAEVAQAYESASEGERRKLDVLLNLKLREVTRNKRPLEEIMDEISRNAHNRGLTPEILDSILNKP